MSYNLIDEAWIEVQTRDGTREVSLRDLFHQARDIIAITGEIPTQAVAILRLCLAILYRATRARRSENEAVAQWERWWTEGLPLDQIDGYLATWHHRFDLRHPSEPFMQVAGLATKTGKTSGLHKLIADLPDGEPFFTTRAGAGRSSLGPAEAARWLVHCHQFDPAGIKTGPIGDDRVKKGKGYSMGYPAWAGNLGLVLPQGATLHETLLLNLILHPDDPEQDRPVWERDQLTAAVEGRAAPMGAADAFTWPSRRVRLLWSMDVVIDVLLANGDPLGPQNLHEVEPMSAWAHSDAQTKKLGSPTFMPAAHVPGRQVWRGLGGILAADGATRRRPRVLEWLALLREEEVLPLSATVRLRTVGLGYGTQNSVITGAVDDYLTCAVAAITDDDLIACAVEAVGAAGDAVRCLTGLAANLADATFSSQKDAACAKARVAGYAALDPEYRRWLSGLDASTDRDDAAEAWRRTVRDVIKGEGVRLVADSAPDAMKGREIDGRGHVDSFRAWEMFEAALKKALPITSDATSKEDAS